MPDPEVEKLLEPWFGPDVPVEALPVPRLIEVTEADEGFDADALRLRLQGEAPGAALDDHTRWRSAAGFGGQQAADAGAFLLLLIAAAAAAMITLAAKAALAANGQVIRVLRLIGAWTSPLPRPRAAIRRAAMGAAAAPGECWRSGPCLGRSGVAAF